jgi:hypothetical protein
MYAAEKRLTGKPIKFIGNPREKEFCHAEDAYRRELDKPAYRRNTEIKVVCGCRRCRIEL